MCLQEIKIQTLSIGVVRSFGAGKFSEWEVEDAIGAAGQILLFWDMRVLELIEMVTRVFYVSC